MRGQRGLVLVVALLVLLLTAIIATAVAATSLLQLRMAGNDEAEVVAQQQALSAVDAVLSDPGATTVRGQPGYRRCTPGAGPDGCDQTDLDLDDRWLPGAGGTGVTVTRIAPAGARLPPMAQDRASSAVAYRVAKFEVRAVHDDSLQGGARATVVQGVLVRLVAPPGLGDGG